jgi:hypothetical protein
MCVMAVDAGVCDAGCNCEKEVAGVCDGGYSNV